MSDEKKSVKKPAKEESVKKPAKEKGAKKLVNPDLTRYKKAVTGEGKEKVSHIDIDDLTAKELRAHTLGEVYELAALFSGTTAVELEKRYKHLNPGMQRMNCGNRIRTFVKEGAYKTLKEAVHDAKQAQKKVN